MSMKSFKLSAKEDKSIWERFYLWRYEQWDKLPYSWKEFYWQVRGFCWDRHTTIKSRHLDHTWCDKDVVLVYTTFEILERFLEEECGEDGIVDWYTNAEVTYCRMKKEYVIDILREALSWWNDEYLPFINGKHPLEKEYHATMGVCRLLEDDPDERHEDGSVTYYSLFRYESKEQEDKYKEVRDRYYKLEEDMEAKLGYYAGLVWKFRRYMWT